MGGSRSPGRRAWAAETSDSVDDAVLAQPDLLHGLGDHLSGIEATVALGADVLSVVCGEVTVASSGSAGRGGRSGRHQLSSPIGIDADISLVAERVGDEFTTEEKRLLSRLARSLSPASVVRYVLERERILRAAYDKQGSHNASVSTKLETQHNLLQQLLRIQRLISSLTPLQSILDEIVSAATSLIGDEVGNIRLQDPEQPDHLILAGRISDPSANITRVEWIRPGQGATGRAFSEERLIVAEDYSRASSAIPAYAASKVEACMAAPVRQNGRVIGVMVVATQRKGRKYTVEEQEILLAFAEHASLALTDAQRISAVEHMAFHDTLTGLPNRAYFMERLNQALGRARSDPSALLAVLFIDIDHFKIVNDSLGHAAGDTLLGVIGRRLVESIRTDDVAARLGGDEFAVLLEDVNRSDSIDDVVTRLLANINTPAAVGDHTIPVAASVGTAMSDGSHDATELLRNADLAMFSAKTQGRHRAVAYDPSMHSHALARLHLEDELRQAVAGDQFEVHYQPIVALDTGEPCGVEALVRWRHPARGLVAPAEFIPLADETGLIVQIGGYVLGEATRQVAAWRSGPGHSDLTLAVNVSARQLQQAEFVDGVRTAIRSSGLDPRSLILEITESTIVEDSASLRDRLRDLKALGLRFALDDFGTGYSSLSNLWQFPIDVLKIDRAFVSRLAVGGDGTAMIAAIVSLGRALHLEVVAEGIEQSSQTMALRELGCSFGQGFLYSRPLSAAAMTNLLKSSRVTTPCERPSNEGEPR